MKSNEQVNSTIRSVKEILENLVGNLDHITSANFPHEFGMVRCTIQNCAELIDKTLSDNMLYQNGYSDGVKEGCKISKKASLQAFRGVLLDNDNKPIHIDSFNDLEKKFLDAVEDFEIN